MTRLRATRFGGRARGGERPGAEDGNVVPIDLPEYPPVEPEEKAPLWARGRLLILLVATAWALIALAALVLWRLA